VAAVVAMWALVGWTLFVWGTRIVNILDDGGALAGLVPAVGLTALAVAAGVALRGRRGRPTWAPAALVVATVAVWAVRVPLLLVGDRSGAFVAVHVALAGVSVALALAGGRWLLERAPASARS
jgi:hypothetical protein